MAAITAGASTFTPQLISGYQSSRNSGNIIHPIIGSNSPAVTLKAAQPRTGQLSMLFLTHAQALAVEAVHASASTLTLTDSTLPGLNMTYVAIGDITTELDEQSRELWWVRVGFQELL